VSEQKFRRSQQKSGGVRSGFGARGCGGGGVENSRTHTMEQERCSRRERLDIIARRRFLHAWGGGRTDGRRRDGLAPKTTPRVPQHQHQQTTYFYGITLRCSTYSAESSSSWSVAAAAAATDADAPNCCSPPKSVQPLSLD